MTGNTFIRHFLGILFLAVFALSITPKQLLHDAIANHKHQPAQKTGEAHVEKSSFICNCADQVAESTFLPSSIITQLPALYIYDEAYEELSASLFSIARIESQLRGPPSIG